MSLKNEEYIYIYIHVCIRTYIFLLQTIVVLRYLITTGPAEPMGEFFGCMHMKIIIYDNWDCMKSGYILKYSSWKFIKIACSSSYLLKLSQHMYHIYCGKKGKKIKKVKEKKTFQVKKNRNDIFNRVLCQFFNSHFLFYHNIYIYIYI